MPKTNRDSMIHYVYINMLILVWSILGLVTCHEHGSQNCDECSEHQLNIPFLSAKAANVKSAKPGNCTTGKLDPLSYHSIGYMTIPQSGYIIFICTVIYVYNLTEL